MKRLTATLLSVAAMLLLVGGPLGTAEAAAQSPIVVEMANSLRFSPQEVRIEQGQSVRWVNTSQIAHTVTTDAGEALDASNVRLPDGAQAFNSGVLDPGETYTYTFNQPGTYQYVCVVHEGVKMTGRVVVE